MVVRLVVVAVVAITAATTKKTITGTTNAITWMQAHPQKNMKYHDHSVSRLQKYNVQYTVANKCSVQYCWEK